MTKDIHSLLVRCPDPECSAMYLPTAPDYACDKCGKTPQEVANEARNSFPKSDE